jgi:hypothetical protein
MWWTAFGNVKSCVDHHSLLKWARQHPSQTETSQEMNQDTKCTDKKKKIKFSLYIRKFRMEQLHSHI